MDGRKLSASPLSITMSDGVPLHVEQQGDGERAVVLCHSLASSSDDLEPLAAVLASRRYRVARYDQRGHGRSNELGTVTMRRLALDVIEIARSLGYERPIAVGHSSGGYALLALSPDEASYFSSLVTVGTTPQLTSATERLTMMYARSALAARLQRWHPLGARLVRLGAFGAHPRLAQVEGVWRSAASCPSSTRKAYLAAMLAAPDLRKNLREFTIPVVSLRGDRDRVVSRQRAEEVAALAIRGRLVEVHRAGHMVVVEHPDAVADAITR